MRLIDADAILKPFGKQTHDTRPVISLRDIDDLPTIDPASNWIPCAERLPGDFEKCVISYEICNSERVEEAFLRNGKWVTRYGIIAMTEKVLAWQPLPDPYSPDQKED